MNIDVDGVAIPAGGLLARDDVLASLDEWVEDDQRTPTRVILGGPGVGKSAIVRKWIDHRQARIESGGRSERLIAHPIKPAQDPTTIVQSLIEQCEHIAPVPDGPAATPDRPHLEGALKRAAAGRRCLIVVLDALDETTDLARLRDLLPSPLPPGVRLLCSSRPRPTANAGLGAAPAVSSLDLDHGRWTASNDITCSAFWAARRAEVDWLTQIRIEEALRAGQGNMLYAVQLWRLLSSLPGDERDSGETPADLDTVIDRSWQRIACLPATMAQPIRDALGVLSLAREPLQLTQLIELAAWPRTEDDNMTLRECFLANMRPILRCDTVEAFSLYHSALAGPIQRRNPGLVSLHRAMIPRLTDWLQRDGRQSRAYAERHLLDHCVQAGCWAEAIALGLRRSFLERWLPVSDPVLAAKLLDNVANEAAEGRPKAMLTRLARAVRECPDTWLEEIEPLLRADHVVPPPPAPRTGRLMVIATASPDRLPKLQVDEEGRLIKNAWAARPGLVRFDFCPAARFGDLRSALSAGPNLLHVGCHGVRNGPLEFESDAENSFCPGPKNFVRLVRALSTSLELIVFNTCYSAELAKELSEGQQIVPLALGMAGAIRDHSAIAFMTVFYADLAVGYPIQDAFDEALDQIDEQDRKFPKLFASSPEVRYARLFPPVLPP